MKITAPWSAQQVAALNQWQAAGFVHPFTCVNDHDGDRDLIATHAGWRCRHCDYQQDWAHDFMFVQPVNPMGA